MRVPGPSTAVTKLPRVNRAQIAGAHTLQTLSVLQIGQLNEASRSCAMRAGRWRQKILVASGPVA